MRKKVAIKKDLQAPLSREFFMFILLISDHTVFLIQFGTNLHCEFFKKLKLHSPKRIVRAISAF